MTTRERVRYWMRIATCTIPVSRELPFRSVEPGDAGILAALMDSSYRDTIDYEGETVEQCAEEMKGTLTGKYGPFLDFASFLVMGSTKESGTAADHSAAENNSNSEIGADHASKAIVSSAQPTAQPTASGLPARSPLHRSRYRTEITTGPE